MFKLHFQIGYYWYIRTLYIFVSWYFIQKPCWILFINSNYRFSWIFYESSNMQIMTVLIFPFKYFFSFIVLSGTTKIMLTRSGDSGHHYSILDYLSLSFLFTFDIWYFHYCSVLEFHNFYFDFIPMSYIWVHLNFSKHIIFYLLALFDFWLFALCLKNGISILWN